MSELPDTLTALAKPDLFEAFKAQLKKDFEMCAIDSDFVSGLNSDYGLLLQTLAKEVEKIMKASTKLSDLLYRIDISENQLKKLSKEKSDSDLSDVVAELVIKRELQKVVIRKMYKE